METDFPLIKNKEFEPFLIEETTPDICINFHQSEKLLQVPEKVIFSGACMKAAAKGERGFQKFFYEKPEDPVHYAVGQFEDNNRNIQIKYLESYRRCVSELQNCFFHIGFESVLLDRDKLCLHAACVDTPAGGILFSGVSGIGKSTQADLWCKYRKARQINGDRPILSKEEGGWFAWGSPYAGSSKCHVNDKCCISAIVLLKQSDTCKIRKLTLAEAFRGVWAGMTVHTWEASFVERASDLTITLVSKIPVYEFCCTADETAVDFLEQALRKELNT